MSAAAKDFKDALKALREKNKKRNFNQSIELIINLREIDMKKPEGKIQETVELPHPLNRKISVCVFAAGDMALRAKRSGADLVLEREEIEGLANDKKKQRQIAKSTDAFLAAAPLMPLVGKVFGAILGPRGKMPAPIAPTANIENEIERHKKLTTVRTRNQPVLQCRVGTENMSDDEIIENIQTVLRRVEGKLKRGNRNIGSICIKATMGPTTKVSTK
jgi:large subunit ribosomal protein L1